MSEIKIKRAAPRTVGEFFLAGPAPDEHRCRPACYRVNERHHWIFLLCDYGHSAGGRDTHDGYFGGSAFAASLNDLPFFAPFVAADGAS